MAFLITKELIFGFQILDLKDHFSASSNHQNNLRSVLNTVDITFQLPNPKSAILH